MTTVLFVHGTGVRQTSYERRFDDVRAGIAAIRPRWSVRRCYWGDEHGARLHADGVTIPTVSARALGEPVEEPSIVLWWALERDPFFELRILAEQDSVRSPFLPSSGVDGEQHLVGAARALPDAALTALLTEVGLAHGFSDAVDRVLADEVCDRALSHWAELGETLAAPLARAFVAMALTEADRDGGVALDGTTRDAVVRAIVSALGASVRGFGLGGAAAMVANIAMRAGGSRYVDRKRAAWSEAAAPLAGDVLRYLARGGRIKDFIAERVAEIDGPVVLLAHSLGGIAALELFITRSVPQVELLVTVGSQGPLLYELDSLPTLPFGTALPDHMPSWVNVYDHRDLLAYRGSEVFPGRVTDHAVDNRTPFPTAHSAYFFRRNTRFYDLLDQLLP
ncbi:hypothetical protein [Nocardia xishanensis]|uniref:AB hydrolase-1 domain-containing protein n=1 Tax=Nocardia xishanensis TaxID=238964 RepID=A0ABW7XAN7_9NOCA